MLYGMCAIIRRERASVLLLCYIRYMFIRCVYVCVYVCKAEANDTIKLHIA